MRKLAISLLFLGAVSCGPSQKCVKSHTEVQEYDDTSGLCMKFNGGIGFSPGGPMCGSGLGIPLSHKKKTRTVRVCDVWVPVEEK